MTLLLFWKVSVINAFVVALTNKSLILYLLVKTCFISHSDESKINDYHFKELLIREDS